MTTAGQVLDLAASQLGYAEDPPGSNHTKFGTWYGLDHQPWCAMFVSWCFFTAGLPLPASTSKGFAYTPSGADWFKRRGRWAETPDTGDVVFFDFPGDGVNRISHVGIVEALEADAILTIEGNTDEAGGRTGGKVMRRRRRVGIAGYGRPEYSEGVNVSTRVVTKRNSKTGALYAVLGIGEPTQFLVRLTPKDYQDLGSPKPEVLDAGDALLTAVHVGGFDPD